MLLCTYIRVRQNFVLQDVRRYVFGRWWPPTRVPSIYRWIRGLSKCGLSNSRERVSLRTPFLFIPTTRCFFDEIDVLLFAIRIQWYPILLSHPSHLVWRIFHTSPGDVVIVRTFELCVMSYKSRDYVGTIQKIFCLFSTFSYPITRKSVVFDCLNRIFNGTYLL